MCGQHLDVKGRWCWPRRRRWQLLYHRGLCSPPQLPFQLFPSHLLPFQLLQRFIQRHLVQLFLSECSFGCTLENFEPGFMGSNNFSWVMGTCKRATGSPLRCERCALIYRCLSLLSLSLCSWGLWGRHGHSATLFANLNAVPVMSNTPTRRSHC